MSEFRWAGKRKATLLALSDVDIKDAYRELFDYVDRLGMGGGTRNWATQHIGVYEGRLRAVAAEMERRGFGNVSYTPGDVPRA